MIDRNKNVPCRVCKKPTLVQKSRLCTLCNALIFSLVSYTPEERAQLEIIVAFEADEL